MPNGYFDANRFPTRTRGADAKTAADPVEQPPNKLYGVPLPNGVSDYERSSWRWNDVDALRYDLDEARRNAANARKMASLGGIRNAQLLGNVARYAGAFPSLFGSGLARAVLSPPATALTALVQTTGQADAPHWEGAARQIEARLRHLGVDPDQ